VMVAREPSLHVGGNVALHIKDRDVSWPIVGIVKEVGGSTVYAPSRFVYLAADQSPEMTRGVRVVARDHSEAGQLAAQRSVERAMLSGGFEVLGISRLTDRRRSFEDHLLIIKGALVVAALLVIIVGVLGLTSTLTLNVLERTREIGVLGAIGASPRTIARHITVEALIIGVLSWIVAIVVAIPITFVLARMTGEIFLKSSIGFVMSPLAVAAWLVLVLVLAALSSFYPARRSVRLTIREALAYE
jgi:putative ABC transport system permease protein